MRAWVPAFAVVVAITSTFAGAQTQPPAGTPFQQAYPLGPRSGVTDPVVIKEARPAYTADARAAKVEGVVELEAVVEPDGTIQNVRVTKSLDRGQYGLDMEAMSAAKKWLFKPGLRDGRPVPVLVTLILEFRLNRGEPPLDTAYTAGGRVGSTPSAPVAIETPRAVYTPAAARARIQGVVEIEAVVLPNGSIDAPRVVKSLDRQFGLDDEALAAVRRWRFQPAMLGGRPVPMTVTLIVEFRNPPGEPAIGQPPAPVDEFTKGAYAATTPGLKGPNVRRRVLPEYTAEAMQMKIQGIAEVEAVVLPSGRVDRVRLKKSLDSAYGLDDAALAAAKQFEFEPNSGTLNGQPVPVVVTIQIEFKLH